MPGKKLSVVPVDQIPKEIIECPTKDLVGLYGICLQMQEICTKEHGIGLAAVQVGIPWKLFVISYMEAPNFRFFLNCRYEFLSEETEKSLEGCLSLRSPNGWLRHFEVPRFKEIRVTGQELVAGTTLKVEQVVLEPKDMYRIVFQHEIDHYFSPVTGKPTLISEIGTEYEVWK